jgi:hypothetical protein
MPRFLCVGGDFDVKRDHIIWRILLHLVIYFVSWFNSGMHPPKTHLTYVRHMRIAYVPVQRRDSSVLRLSCLLTQNFLPW